MKILWNVRIKRYKYTNLKLASSPNSWVASEWEDENEFHGLRNSNRKASVQKNPYLCRTTDVIYLVNVEWNMFKFSTVIKIHSTECEMAFTAEYAYLHFGYCNISSLVFAQFSSSVFATLRQEKQNLSLSSKKRINFIYEYRQYFVCVWMLMRHKTFCISTERWRIFSSHSSSYCVQEIVS